LQQCERMGFTMGLVSGKPRDQLAHKGRARSRKTNDENGGSHDNKLCVVGLILCIQWVMTDPQANPPLIAAGRTLMEVSVLLGS
jgi:hypothetical protein